MNGGMPQRLRRLPGAPAAGRALAATRQRAQRPGAIDGVLIALGIATGFVTGLAATALFTTVGLVQSLAWTDPAPVWQVLLLPALGGLIVGLLVTKVVPEAAGGGVVATMETLALHGGRFRKRVPLGSFAATSIALGTGASGGREGPVVLLGGAIGAWFSRLVPIDESRTRALVAAGAAAGIGAAFNAPVGGMLFAIEVLQIGLRGAGLQLVVVGSVVGSVTARQLVGEGLIFQPRRDLVLGDPVELLVYVILGFAAVAVAVGYQRAEQLAREGAVRLRAVIGRTGTLGLAGLAVGAIALLVPEVLGDGDELPPVDGVRQPIQTILDADFGTGWQVALTLAVLLVAKLIATSLTIGAGSAVGSFSPMLLMGAALGAIIGIAAQPVLPDLDVGAVATVGMAAVFAATARAPLTAILIVFELVGDYGLVLPLMTAVGLATFLGDRIRSEGIYHATLRRRGVVLGQPDDVDVLQTVQVGEVMTPEHPTVPAGELVADLARRFSAGGTHGYAVVDDAGGLVGVVTSGDVDRREGRTAADVCTRRALTVGPDDPVFVAVRRMASLDVGRVPVVEPATRKVLGMLRRSDVVQAYRRGLNRSAADQQRQAAGELRNLTGVRFVELVIDASSPLADHAVRDVRWPERTVLTSVRRDGEILLPTGDTVLQVGDEVVVLTADVATVRALVAGTAADA